MRTRDGGDEAVDPLLGGGDFGDGPQLPGPGRAAVALTAASDAQRSYYLPRLARGEDIPCFALDQPICRFDAGAIPDLGIVCKGTHEGEQVLGFRVTWDKRYITLGPIATVLGLAFRAEDPDGLLGAPGSLGITCALIPTSTPA